MYKVSDIISTPVISIYECSQQGIVYNLLFDTHSKKCKYACIFNEEENIQKILKMSHIYNIGQECIFIKNNTFLNLECTSDHVALFTNPILNLHVYNLNGKHLGICKNIELDEKYNILNIILDNNTVIDGTFIANIGKNLILIDEVPFKKNKYSPKLKNVKKNLDTENIIALSDINQLFNNQTESSKIITDYRFLIGRFTNKEIISNNGEVIAKKNTQITKDIVQKASLNGRLVELTRYSSKNKKM